ncbi:MAG TPA: hypothetical protein VFD92_24145 [Candidatus Binatia bacterium]|nr:hypothetical protein [Candidatus Binatia bacterium]
MKKRRRRALAVDLNTRGFGFVVLEGNDRLVDWGLRDIRHNKERLTLEKIDELIRLYRPSVLVVEDVDDPTARRGPRIEALVRRVADVAAEKRLPVRRISAGKVRGLFASQGAVTKHDVAGVIVARFPELAPYRPPRRRLWMSEDQRQAVFDAVTLAIANLP